MYNLIGAAGLYIIVAVGRGCAYGALLMHNVYVMRIADKAASPDLCNRIGLQKS